MLSLLLGGAPTSARVIVFLASAMALGCLLLGLLPWSRVGTAWRPARAEMEELARGHWDEETISRGREFRSNGYRLFFLRRSVVALLLVGTLVFGAHHGLRLFPGGSILGPTLALVVCSVAVSIVGIPFRLAALANLKAFGLSTQSVGLWFADYGKSLAIGVATTAIAAAVLFLLIQRFPRTWPLPATVASGLGGIVFAWLLPVFIAPLFNTFSPLEDEALARRVLALADEGGVPTRTVLVSDASRRTRAVNAYFSGFGPSRQIVLYDTLLESLTPDQTIAVVAHEIGHWRHSHIVKGISLGTLGVGVALVAAFVVFTAVSRQSAFGLSGWADPAAAPLLLLLLWIGGLVALPVENAVSRRMERQADTFALDLTDEPDTQIEVEIELAKRNLSDVVPPPFVETLLFTHPGQLERIALAQGHRKD